MGQVGRWTIAATLLLAGCGPDGLTLAPIRSADPDPIPPAPLVLDPETLGLISELERTASRTVRAVGTLDGQVSPPGSYQRLVDLGGRAVPTLLEEIRTTDTGWMRDLLIEIAGHIRDPRSRRSLVSLTRHESVNTQQNAIAALGRLGMKESLPDLWALRAKARSDGNHYRLLEVLDALYQLGDESVIPDAIAVGLQNTVPGTNHHTSLASQLVLRHAPLRKALGFEADYARGQLFGGGRILMLRAADEWYREQVLKTTSPYRVDPTDLPAGEYAEAKAAAWERFVSVCDSTHHTRGKLRPKLVDPVITDADADRTIVYVTGSGENNYGKWLRITLFRPTGSGVIAHRFWWTSGGARPAYARATITRRRYTELVAGLRTIFSSHAVPWWSGPGWGGWGSTGRIVASFTGAGDTPAATKAYCGSPGSSGRPRYVHVLAARRWLRFKLGDGLFPERSPVDDCARAEFERVRSQLPATWERPDEWAWTGSALAGLAAAMR